MSDAELMILTGLGLVLLAGWALGRLLLPNAIRQRGRPGRPVGRAERPILVDGSNVMYWDNETPTERSVNVVLRDLERQGYDPYVCFDANVGYKIGRRYLGSRDLGPILGLPTHRVLVSNKGVVADEVLLEIAKEKGVKIVSNDRFRDWAGAFPFVSQRERFLRGSVQDGAVRWRGAASGRTRA